MFRGGLSTNRQLAVKFDRCELCFLEGIEYENEYFATVGDECCNRLQPAKYCVQILLRYDFFVDLQTYQLSSIQLQMLKLHYHFRSKEIAMSIFESERCVARLATSPNELIFHLVLRLT